MHPFFNCEYAKEVWDRIAIVVGFDIMKPGTSVQEVWESSVKGSKTQGSLY